VGEYIGEIIVVHSACAWESEEVINDLFPSVRQLKFEENLGYAKGVNQGLKHTRYPYILILNPDIVVSPFAVKRLVTFMEQNPFVGITGPRLINFNGTTQYSYSRFYTPYVILLRRTLLGSFPFAKKTLDWFHMAGTISFTHPTAADWLMGSALLVRRDAIEKVGNMDEQFFMYFEDVDWCRRFWLAGYSVVYVPRAVMHHYHQRASHQMGVMDILFNSLTRTHIRSAVLFFRKYGISYPEGLVIPLKNIKEGRVSLKRLETPHASSSALLMKERKILPYEN